MDRREISIDGLNELAVVLRCSARIGTGRTIPSFKEEGEGRAERQNHGREQLVLELERQNPQTLVTASTKGLVQALADLLLEALAMDIERQLRGEATMSTKITPDHLGRAAVVYVRQSTMAQVIGNLESQRRQYDLARPRKQRDLRR